MDVGWWWREGQTGNGLMDESRENWVPNNGKIFYYFTVIQKVQFVRTTQFLDGCHANPSSLFPWLHHKNVILIKKRSCCLEDYPRGRNPP